MQHLSQITDDEFCNIYDSWELATALREAKPRFDAAGVKLVAVGVGTPDKARILATRVKFSSLCFSFSVFLKYTLLNYLR